VLNNPTRLVCASLILALSGCVAGPEFRKPEGPNVPGYISKPMGKTALKFAAGKDIPAQWWAIFRSEKLDQLLRLAVSGSPTLAASAARLRQAQENLNAVTGATRLPGVDAGGSAAREKFSPASFGQPGAKPSIFNLFNASVSVSYMLDIFGGTRRELESLRAQVDYQRFQQEGAYLALTSNIVAAVVKESAIRGQIQSVRDILEAQENQLSALEKQLDLGGISRSELLAQRSLLAQTRALLPPLENELNRTRHQLAVLAGRFPSEETELPEFSLADLQIPDELPVSLPSLLARQRPDIRAQEALLRSASAQIGVATANMFPQITLFASTGQEANTLSKLFDTNSNIGSIAAGITQPVFHGGQLRAKRRAAVAAYDEALAQYRETVLLAFENVADVLRALESDESSIKAQADAFAAAENYLKLTQARFDSGAVNYLLLLDAQRQFHQARIGLIQAQASRFADTAALFQALGGGWWNRDL
jgi:NodT family efflux transporter outer membrane factor (OMF) lipoprotein